MTSTFYFTGRRSGLAFSLGSALITLGVLLHLPMFWMGRFNHFVLAGMPMDAGMYWGMATIVGGATMAAYGLLPRPEALSHMRDPIERLMTPEDAPLNRAHWVVMGVLALALVIDIMKPASLGFVVPGMRREYGVDDATVSWLPFAALTGTVLGSFVWGALADLYGRRASILLSAVMFVGTSICGAMPDFWWNVGMCFLMGISAGGMLPVAYALLAEIMPTRHRGWALVLVGGAGAVGGYFAASFLSALLQPTYGWRIMWLLNLPTGLIIIGLASLLPESARFLQHLGRAAEARQVLARFGVVVGELPKPDDTCHSHLPLVETRFIGTTAALTLAALAWGLVNFGLLLWLPSALETEGLSVTDASALIAKSSVMALPIVAVCTYLYSAWSTKWSLASMMGIISLGLLTLQLRGADAAWLSSPIVSTTLMVVGSTGAISVLLPYTAESYPLRIRGRASGWIAGCSKLGGLLAQSVGLFLGTPPLGLASLAIGIPAIASIALIAKFGAETRGRDLRALDVTPVRRTKFSGEDRPETCRSS
jgi:MFS transporter, putative metabolite:H+ symporter